jgi:hypothetical protein
MSLVTSTNERGRGEKRTKVAIHRSRHPSITDNQPITSVESRDEVEGTNEACRFAYDLDVKIVSYQHERIRRKKGTNGNSESTVEIRV